MATIYGSKSMKFCSVCTLERYPGRNIVEKTSKFNFTEKMNDIKMESVPEKEAERGSWAGKLDFLLSCIGYAVGLGNIWRFPYICYDNGGASFLIPYIIMLVLCGLPIFYFELCLGQFSSLGPVTLWAHLSPMFKGIGVGMVVISGLTCIYYNMILAYSFYFLLMSFAKDVPWKTCDNDWNTKACVPQGDDMPKPTDIYPVIQNNVVLGNVTYGMKCNEKALLANYPAIFDNVTEVLSTYLKDEMCALRRSAAEEFYERKVLQLSGSWENYGYPLWQLVLSLFVSWVVVYLCLFKGVLSSGKVVYFTALFPYVVLIILCIRGATLEGSLSGVKFYIIPKWEKLATAKVWIEAAKQIFYSLGPAFGGLITMASYNSFKNNCQRDAVIVAIINCSTSIFAGFVIFSVIGFMATKLNVNPEDVAAKGAGLAFIVYPQGISMMPISPLWAILFFIMIITLGLDSQFVMMETVTSALFDEYPKLRPKKWLWTAVLCIIWFILGIPLCCPGGMYLLTLMSDFTASYSLLFLCLSELLVTMYIYGFRNFFCDIELMLGKKPNYYWISTWLVITPLVVTIILIWSIVEHSPSVYNDKELPAQAQTLGMLMILISLIVIPIMAIFETCRYAGGFKFFLKMLRPLPTWGPAENEYRDDIRYKKIIYNESQSIPGNTTTKGEQEKTTL